jgi:hypothetical protein
VTTANNPGRKRRHGNVSWTEKAISRSQRKTGFRGGTFWGQYPPEARIPAVGPLAPKAIRSTVRDLNIRQLTQRSLADIARKVNLLLRGWIGYYGRYNRAMLGTMLRHVNLTPAPNKHAPRRRATREGPESSP